MCSDDEGYFANWWNNMSDQDFQEIFRMSKRTLYDLQAEIDYYEDINEDRLDKMLLACLWILGNTKPFETVEKLFGVQYNESKFSSYFRKILKLDSTYINWPKLDELKLIENRFASEYHFPGLVGVVGSLHVEVNIDNKDDASQYYNSVMDKHTIVLQVVCDNHLLLRDICVGYPGGMSAKEVLIYSPLYALLVDKEGLLSRNDFHLLGGTEHPQLNTLLTPYRFSADGHLKLQQQEFNTLHASLMYIVEKTFRCMEIRFPRLTSVDNLNLEFATLIASCVCVLHNFTRVRNDNCQLYM